MGLFSKPKVPSIDTGALTRIAEENARKQQGIITGLKGNLNPINQNFETKRNTLSAAIPGQTEETLGAYGRDLSNVGQLEQNANTQAVAAQREQSFRDVPELQRAIRESLGSSGTTGNAAALSAVSRPVIDAARQNRDFGAQLENNRLTNQANRGEKLADTGFNARSSAMSTKLGLDTDTVNYLTSIGREDLVREAEGLLGSEEQLGSNRLGIEQARQANEAAKASASNSFRNNIISGLTQLGGAGVGFLAGGPMGAGLGAQLGGTAGQLATGSPVQFDPTLLYAMANRNPAPRRTAIVNGLQTPVRPY